MSVYALTPLAKADIFDIWSYIAVDSEEIANRVEQAIYNGCAFVAEAPTRGHSAPISPAAPFVSGRLPVILTTPLCTGPKRLPFRLSPFCTGREIYGAY
jgi:plasmid stabilization system protein ParE